MKAPVGDHDVITARRRQVDDEFIRNAKETNFRCSHQHESIHGHTGSCAENALAREKRLLEILERRS